MDRAKNIPSTEEEAIGETKRVAEALTANNYPANFIYNGRQRNRQQEVNGSDQRGVVVLLRQMILRENRKGSSRFQHQGRS